MFFTRKMCIRDRYKTTTRVNYRSGAGTKYGIKGTLASGKQIEVENGYSKTANGYTWYRFKMNGKEYYLASKYVKKVSTGTSTGGASTSKPSAISLKSTGMWLLRENFFLCIPTVR